MTVQRRDTGSMREHEHGTMRSYIIGFIFSLILTLIPYYLVVNQIVSGTTLLVTIMGYAVLQAIIQITFFLHLGRGPKPKWNLFFFISTVGIILIVVGGSIVIIDNLHYNMQPSDQTKKLIAGEAIYQIGGKKTGACQGQYANHIVTIGNGQVSPLRTVAVKCDTLTFISGDGDVHQITFGTYTNNEAYAGENDLSVRKGHNETIALSEPGTYKFYDSLHSELTGGFSVTP